MWYSSKRLGHERRINDLKVERNRRQLIRRKSDLKQSKRMLILSGIGTCVSYLSWLTYFL